MNTGHNLNFSRPGASGRHRRVRPIGALVVAFALLLLAVAPVSAQSIVQTYYVPLPEDDLLSSFQTINTSGGTTPASVSPVNTYNTIAVAATGTVIYYDHGEDGYDALVFSPGVTTEVWGDGDLTNGVAPGYPGDLLTAGDVIILSNPVPSPRDVVNDGILYDGGDKISSTDPVAVTRSAFATGSGSLLAGAVEVAELNFWGTTFIAPVGENTADLSGTNPFQSTQLYVMATENGTEVFLNGNSQGIINEGETLVLDNIDQGDEITASAPIQVDMIVGDVGSTYEMRWYALPAFDDWTNDYYTPVGEEVGSTGVWFYNPTASQITISYDFQGGGSPDGSFNVPANSVVFRELDGNGDINLPGDPGSSGIRFYTDSQDDIFWAFTQTDADSGGQTYDWGHPMIPANLLSSRVLVGDGRGNTPDNPNVTSHSVVWITPIADAVICVDFDGDGGVDYSTTAVALEQVRIWDESSDFSGAEDDNNMSGAIIFARSGNDCSAGQPVNIAAAWGQDPSRTSADSSTQQANSLDMGTVIYPLPDFESSKSASLLDDADQDGEFTPGDTIEYVIRVDNVGQAPLTALTVADILPNGVDYVPNSTKWVRDAVETPIADNNGFPLDAALNPNYQLNLAGDPLLVGEFVEFVFQATIQQNQLSIEKTATFQQPNVTFVIEIQNTGSNTVFDVTISDDVSADLNVLTVTPTPAAVCLPLVGNLVACTFDELAPNATAQLVIETELASEGILFVENTACVDSEIQNLATVTANNIQDDSSVDTLVIFGCDTSDTTVPVTVGYVSTRDNGDGTVTFLWQTATETGNAGFNLYADTDGGLVQLNPEFIPSTVIDSVEPTDYSYTAVTDATRFYIEDVTTAGGTEMHGPFSLGQTVGSYVNTDPVATDHAVYLPFISGQ